MQYEYFLRKFKRNNGERSLSDCQNNEKKKKKETQACKLLSRIKIHVLTNKLRSKCINDFLIIDTHGRIK